jgi:CheY-like chemotaxis protein
VLRHKAPDEHAPRPALIRLSLKLPGMSEQQFLAELKRDPALRPIPALVFTNSKSPQDSRQSYELGANASLLKPFEFTHVVEMVHIMAVYWLPVVTRAPLPHADAEIASGTFGVPKSIVWDSGLGTMGRGECPTERGGGLRPGRTHSGSCT